MDLATLIGIFGCAAAVVYGIVSGDQGVAALGNFWDMPSFLIVFIGCLMCMMTMSDSIGDFVKSLKSFLLTIKTSSSNEGDTIHKIIDLANVARKEGLLQLEEAAGEIDDDFLKKGIMLIVDGTDQELVSSILETELNCIEDRHGKVIGFWESLAGMGPAWGMIGTLIGLINMLKLLDDPSSIGPNMAVALITTLYGSLIANWLCIPIATKLRAKNKLEIRMKEVVCEGILSIQAGENPRVIEEKLKSFLAPSVRDEVLGGGNTEQGGEG
ncbi:MAG: motility protein A [Lachnospiraceae bacterium]|nr:motility protein A [Lachnospiraceae bacterium]